MEYRCRRRVRDEEGRYGGALAIASAAQTAYTLGRAGRNHAATVRFNSAPMVDRHPKWLSSDSSSEATVGGALTTKELYTAGQAFINLFQGKLFSFGANVANLAARPAGLDRFFDLPNEAALGVAQQSGRSAHAVASALTTLTSGPAALSLLGYIGALGWVVEKTSAFAKACTDVQSGEVVATQSTLANVIQEFVKAILVQATKATLPLIVGKLLGNPSRHAFTVAAALSDLAGALIPKAEALSYSVMIKMIWTAAMNPATYDRCKLVMQENGHRSADAYASNYRSMGNTQDLVELAIETFPNGWTDGGVPAEAARLLFVAVALGLIPSD